MSEYNCGKCFKRFDKKDAWLRHKNRKTPCVSEEMTKHIKKITKKPWDRPGYSGMGRKNPEHLFLDNTSLHCYDTNTGW